MGVDPTGQLAPDAGSPPAGPGTGSVPQSPVNLRTRIGWAASSGFVILGLVVAVTVRSSLQVRRSINDLTTLNLAGESFRSVENSMITLESAQRGFLLTGDSTLLAPFDAALVTLEPRMDSLRKVARAFPDDSADFHAVDSLVNVRVTQLTTNIAAYSPDDNATVVRQMMRNMATGVSDSLHALLAALSRTGEARRVLVTRMSARAGENLILAEVLGGAFAAILLLVALRQIFADLDAREQAEASLRQSESFLDSIIDLMPLMVFVKEARDLRFVRFNRTAEQLVGVPREQVLGRTDFELFPKPLAQGFATMDRAVLATTAVRDIPEEMLVAPNGAIRTMHTRKVAVRDETGQAAFLLGVSEDITERKRTEAEVRRARETAEAANRAKSDFLAKMSHELRTPLNSIIGFSQLLEEQSFGPLNERQRRYVNNVLTSGRQLLDLINDVLDLSKVEAGRMELLVAHAQLRPLLHEALSLVEPLAVQRGLRLSLDAPEPLPAVLIDVARFRQILFNLLGNAIKFTEPGGVVTLRAGLSPNRSRSDSAMARITVSDTGIGIRPDDLERIFREFEQVDPDVDNARKGTGLGLALARRLAELHGGRIWAESEFGLGSSFHLEVPVSVDPTVDPRASISIDPTFDAPMVLVVEDDEAAAATMRGRLSEAGYQTVVSGSDASLMSRVRESTPAAVVIGVLPSHRGVTELVREIKSDPRTAPLPIILAAAVYDKVHGLSLGQCDWLAKPVQRDALLRAVQRSVNDADGYPLVVAVDRDPSALDVISTILEGAGLRTASTTDPVDALAMLEELQPAAVILDLSPADATGIELLAQVRRSDTLREVPLILFGSSTNHPDARQRIERAVAEAVVASPHLLDEMRRAGIGVATT